MAANLYKKNEAEESSQLSDKRKIRVESERLKAVGLIHAWSILLIPLLGAIIGLVQILTTGIGPLEIWLLAIMYALTILGITVGFHRHFTHCGFRTNPVLRVILVILGSMAAQGSLIFWVATHRRHHQYSDEIGDPHSPNLHGEGIVNRCAGLWHAHVGWMFQNEFSNPVVFAKDLFRDPLIAKVNHLYLWWIGLGLFIPAAVGGLLTQSWEGAFSGFIWGGLVRLFLAHHTTWGINSINHLYGQRFFDTRERSTNNLWLAILTLGEGWHNNHHAFPNSAKFGLRWWQVDSGYWVIYMLERLGLVWDVKRPTVGMIDAKKATQT